MSPLKHRGRFIAWTRAMPLKIVLLGIFMKTQHLLFCLLGLTALAKTVYADEINFGKKTPSANQVIEALNPAVEKPDVDAAEDAIKRNGTSRSIDMSNLNATPRVNKNKFKKIIHAAVHKANTETALSMEI